VSGVHCCWFLTENVTGQRMATSTEAALSPQGIALDFSSKSNNGVIAGDENSRASDIFHSSKMTESQRDHAFTGSQMTALRQKFDILADADGTVHESKFHQLLDEEMTSGMATKLFSQVIFFPIDEVILNVE
jgi:hypothetical protein